MYKNCAIIEKNRSRLNIFKNRKEYTLKKYGFTFLRTSLSLALAAAVAVSAAGCGGKQSQTVPAASTPSAASTVTAGIPTSSSAGTGRTITASIGKDTVESTAAGTAAAADTADHAAGTGMDSTETASAAGAASDEKTSAGSTAPSDSMVSADPMDSKDPTASADKAADGQTSAPAGIAAAGSADADGNIALKESVLAEALVECTGWGQSAGSSLRTASAAVLLLQWANEAQAGNADPALLSSVIKEEIGHLTDEQTDDLRSNWSSISYDAGIILDDYDEVSALMEDAGCAEAAKDAAGNKDSLKNWKAAEHALDNALK